MNRKRYLAVVIALFLVQAVSSMGVSMAQDATLNPPTRITTNYFREMYAALSTALTVYKLDAIYGNTKESIISRYGVMLISPEVKFDLERMDMLKKGWTRYYPFEIRANIFIARIFLTKERAYQPSLPVLFEMEFNDPAVTCQILPDINSILGNNRIKPQPLLPRNEASTSL